MQIKRKRNCKCDRIVRHSFGFANGIATSLERKSLKFEKTKKVHWCESCLSQTSSCVASLVDAVREPRAKTHCPVWFAFVNCAAKRQLPTRSRVPASRPGARSRVLSRRSLKRHFYI